jgi:hypothetical protein
MNKKLLLLGLGLAVLTGWGWYGTRSARAEEAGFSPSIVERLAERFGLNESEVEGVFDEERQARWEEMREVRENSLEQAVGDGVITLKQKQALLAKFGQMQEEREKHREEMKTFMQAQGIDTTKLAPYMGFGRHGGGRGMGMGLGQAQ